MGKKHLDDLWHEAVVKAVDTYKQPPGDEKRKKLLAIWHRCVHSIVIADEGCSCQKGHLEKCLLLSNSEGLAKANASYKFSFENFCRAIEVAIAAANTCLSPTEQELEAGRKIVTGVELAKMHEAVVAYLSHTKLDAQRQAVAVVWQSFFHKAALALDMCGCQQGKPDECWGVISLEAAKAKAAGRGRGFEHFFGEVKKMAQAEETKLLRANPDLLKKA